MVTLCYAICALVWGTTWFAIRWSIAHDGEVGYPIYLAAALRFTVASAILWLLIAAGAGRPLPRSRRQLGWLALAGAVNGVGYALVYTAEEQLPGGLMAVLFGTIPLVTALAATVLKIEKVSRGQVLGAGLALVGLALMVGRELVIGSDTVPYLAAALTAVLASVVYSVLVKQATREVHPLAATAVFITVTGLVSWLPALGELDAMPWPPPLRPALATLYLAVFGSVLAFACYFYLLKHVSLMVANSLVLLQPVIALGIDAVLEHHVALAPLTWLGIGVTLAGVAVNLAVKVRAARAARAPI